MMTAGCRQFVRSQRRRRRSVVPAAIGNAVFDATGGCQRRVPVRACAGKGEKALRRTRGIRPR
jgi:hypothetical protein